MTETSGPILGRATWEELWDRSPRPLLVVPIGSCEQHGPHLPLDTDTRIALALADGLVEAFDTGDVMITPPITISASGEHAAFPGTLSIGTEVMEEVLVELARSADWSSGIVFVNGHGGNSVPVQRACRRLLDEGRRVMVWSPSIRHGDAHAGESETSLMLAIAPELVRMHLATPGRTEPLADLIEDIRAGGVAAVSRTGVLGDPTLAEATHGRALLTRLIVDLVAAVDEWWS